MALQISEATGPRQARTEHRQTQDVDGASRFEEITVYPLVANGIEGAVIRVDDVTERVRAEEEQQSLQAQLTQAQKMEAVGRLAGGVAHDFNNMLSVILGHADLALADVGSEHSVSVDLLEIQKAAERSTDLARQLLAFARKQTVTPKVLDLNETVEGMLKMLRRLIGEDIDLSWRPRSGLWLTKVDPSQIDQVLANLCVNARDAISGVGKVTIQTQNVAFDDEHGASHAGVIPGQYVRLTVSDDGAGMDEEIQEKIFEPFFTTKGAGQGTGLGLATVYGIVKQNDGFLYVDSRPGRGATFTIYLPRHQGCKTETRPDSLATQAPGGNETILLVEDESAILDMTTTLLEQLGYTVLAASSPGAAIHRAETHPGPIHLLLTDVVMPEMNGQDLAERLGAILPEMKRLFMSGYTADVVARHGLLDQGLDFIQKPFSRQDLAAKLRELLERT